MLTINIIFESGVAFDLVFFRSVFFTQKSRIFASS
jgi:hypothetical protein